MQDTLDRNGQKPDIEATMAKMDWFHYKYINLVEASDNDEIRNNWEKLQNLREWADSKLFLTYKQCNMANGTMWKIRCDLADARKNEQKFVKATGQTIEDY